MKLDPTTTRCPTCGMAVKIVRRADGHADHYEPMKPIEIDEVLAPEDPEMVEWLREQRKGKKTVALIGMSSNSCALAPFGDLDVEIWGLNDEHDAPWMTRATRWFQIHDGQFLTDDQTRYTPTHIEWLRKNVWNIPIVMKFNRGDIPKSITFPMRKLMRKYLSKLRRGKQEVTYATSTFADMLLYAIDQGFNRIEVYGFDMSGGTEYFKQKACAEFWMGYALGMGIELYLPETCQLLNDKVYDGT